MLPKYPEETHLAEFSDNGRTFKLHPEALNAWKNMNAKARSDGVQLHIVSAFRSVLRQTEIIAGKKKKGFAEEEIFSVSAPPGHSEHHTGRAIDLNTNDYPPLEEAFEESEAFHWLLRNAKDFGFRLSYQRNNAYGIAYEPWHWFYEEVAQQITSDNADKPRV